jgi:hypothetical protein
MAGSWDARTTNKQKITLEFTNWMELVKRLEEFWDITEGEDRKLLGQTLFDELVYDLDSKRIVDFKIKPWAEPFIELRAALYEDELGEEMKNRFNSGLSSVGSSDSPNGTRHHTITIGRNRGVATCYQWSHTSYRTHPRRDTALTL